MDWKELSLDGFLDPMWFNSVKFKLHECEVVSPDVVELEGVLLKNKKNPTVSLAPGQKVIVTLVRNFSFVTKEEYEAWERHQLAEEEKAKERERERFNKLRQEAEAFNSQLKVPVQWTAAIKPVLSGLTEYSYGDGRNKKTVQHILLLEDLTEGRFKRKQGDYLCTAKSGDNGKFSEIKQEEVFLDGDSKPYMPKVTCKACLKHTERWN